ncbi:VOC family protein (plasmid) [Clavibacter phaseoli]|nr:VOC family protein [Clavibacter phaseoli]UKF38549.1 VOC family protein [Clavibacter phaseoli]
MPRFSGIHHLALTVRDLEVSVAFYERVLGAPPTAQLDGHDLRRELFALPGGTNLGLTQHDPTATGTFTPFQPGLDHLGFAVDSREELELWAEHLTDHGIAHSSIVDVSYGSALSFTDPDEIALEFFTPHDGG